MISWCISSPNKTFFIHWKKRKTIVAEKKIYWGKSLAIIQFLLEFLLVILVSSHDTLISISLENNEKKCAEAWGANRI